MLAGDEAGIVTIGGGAEVLAPGVGVILGAEPVTVGMDIVPEGGGAGVFAQAENAIEAAIVTAMAAER